MNEIHGSASKFWGVLDPTLPIPPVASEPVARKWAPPFGAVGMRIEANPQCVSAARGFGCEVYAWGEFDEQFRFDDPAQHWLQRYHSLGVEGLTPISGGFAVIIIDYRRQKVIAKIDRFARETLCVSVKDHLLHISDSATRCAGGQAELSPQAIFNYLHFHMIPAPQTIFAGVKRLLANQTVIFSKGQIEFLTPPAPVFIEWGRPDFLGLKSEFKRLLSQAVRRRSGQGEVGCFLSGGTDSSTVAGLLNQAQDKPSHAFSIGFDANGYDEMEYARITARHFKCKHVEYYLTPSDVLEDFQRIAGAYDQPFGNSSAIAAYHCARVAKDHGIGRMLAGDGGDELFAGNTRYSEQQLFQPYHRVPRELRSHFIEPLLLNKPWMKKIPGLRQLSGYVRHARNPMPQRGEIYNLLNQFGPENILTDEFIGRIDLSEPMTIRKEAWSQTSTASFLNQFLHYDWRFTLADSDLPKVNTACALAGVEVAYPLLDEALFDLALKLPNHYKVRRGKLRWFFKEALSDFLPPETIRKKKQGFGLPFGPWTVQNPALMKFVTQACDELVDRKILRSDFIQPVLKNQLPAHPGYYGEILYILTSLSHWINKHSNQYP